MRRAVWRPRPSWGHSLAGAPPRPPPWFSTASASSSSSWSSWVPAIKSAGRESSPFTKTSLSPSLSGKLNSESSETQEKRKSFEKVSKLSNLMSWDCFQDSRRSALVFPSLPRPGPSELSSPALHHRPPASLQPAVRHQTYTGLRTLLSFYHVVWLLGNEWLIFCHNWKGGFIQIPRFLHILPFPVITIWYLDWFSINWMKINFAQVDFLPIFSDPGIEFC